MKLDRRQLLGLSSGALLSAAFGGAWHAQAASPAADNLPALFRDRAAAARLGARYLATHRDEAARDILVARIAAAIQTAEPERDPATAPGELRQAVRAAITADFAAARMVDVEGWLLAQTEARLYALEHVSRNDSQPAAGSGLIG
jgi:hypothetical protein